MNLENDTTTELLLAYTLFMGSLYMEKVNLMRVYYWFKIQVSWERAEICVIKWERSSFSEQSIWFFERPFHGPSLLAPRRKQRDGQEHWRPLDSTRSHPCRWSSCSWHTSTSHPTPPSITTLVINVFFYLPNLYHCFFTLQRNKNMRSYIPMLGLKKKKK